MTRAIHPEVLKKLGIMIDDKDETEIKKDFRCRTCKWQPYLPTALCWFAKEGCVGSIETCSYYEYSKIVEDFMKERWGL